MMNAINRIITVIFLAIVSNNSRAFELSNVFSDPKVSIYTGKFILPKGYAADDGIWRDSQGKGIDKPKVNFAGKYWVGLHSCGAECRYYSMLDLSKGAESRVLDIFSTAEPPPRTRDGHLYITNLVTRAQSRILVAQYQVILDQFGDEECREKVFIMKGDLLIPLTKTKIGCTNKQNFQD